MTHRTGNTIPLVSDHLLEDYADGRLDPQTERRVEGIIANDRDLRDKVLRMIAVREAIRGEVIARAGEPREERTWELGRAIERQMKRPKRSAAMRVVPFGMVAASAFALVVVGYNSGMFHSSPSSDLQQAAVQTLLQSGTAEQVAHADPPTPPGEIVPVTTAADQAVQTSSETMPEIVPDFTNFGFDLVETRMVAGENDEAVHLLYEGKSGRRLSLYYSGMEGTDKQQVSVRQEGPLALLFWYADGRSFSMIGEVQRNELLNMARTVTKGISVDKSADGGPRSGTNPPSDPSVEKEVGAEVQSDA